MRRVPVRRKKKPLYKVEWHMVGGRVKVFHTHASSKEKAINNIRGRQFQHFARPPAADFIAELVQPAEPPTPTDDQLDRRYLY